MDADTVTSVASAATAGSRPEMAILTGLVVTLFSGFAALLIKVLTMWRDSVREQAEVCKASTDALAAEVRHLADRIP